jgi:alpha-mannosidase
LTIVRSSTDPDHAPEVAKSTVRYSVVLHDTLVDPATLTRLGMEWNHPLMVLPANMQKGTEKTVLAGAECLTSNVVLTALKMSEDGNGLVVRVVEYNGKSCDAQVKLNPSIVKGYTKATVVDLLERPVAGQAKLADGLLTVAVPARGIVTVKMS